ncbi:hypothetical protein OEW28_18040 [Defluviimonas sp. WL0002]|uniref:Uncharacterized protein n=1 Tax=Albidovulum marisflavi TaxID=2984159 RepID=A0ABT2ZHA2_9RHOB|nr:hypothetical protein [Defluviimonas sp. WL0002]MCV2870518.1 hypothetical protein [Defluviimonas sp. WL0002]
MPQTLLTMPLFGPICAAPGSQDRGVTGKTKDGTAIMDNTPQMTSGEVEGSQQGEAADKKRQMAQESQRRTTQPGEAQQSPRMGEQTITDWASI